MDTKDKLPTFEQIWGGEWIPSRVNRDFIKPLKAQQQKLPLLKRNKTASKKRVKRK